MSTVREAGAAASRAGLWFGLLGGAVAWLVHLMSAYTIAEFGCVSRFEARTYLGLTAVAWLVLAVSAVTVAASVAAGLVARRNRRALARAAGGTVEAESSFGYMARAGVIASSITTLTILVESIPIFYYLGDC